MLELLESYKSELILLAWLSAGLLLVSIAVIPWIIIKIPENYFTERYRVRLSKSGRHPLLAQILTGLKKSTRFYINRSWYFDVDIAWSRNNHYVDRPFLDEFSRQI